MPPRFDQIAELTRGIDLPLPPLHREHLRFIVEALCTAWTVLRERHPQVLLHRDEAEITSLLESKLLAFLDEEPLWSQMVRAVARGRETVSFDGSHLEKRPDLSLFLTCRSAVFPLAIESKIIDEANGKTVKLYCDRGVSRFLRGEYAWATCEAIIIRTSEISRLQHQVLRRFYAFRSRLCPLWYGWSRDRRVHFATRFSYIQPSESLSVPAATATGQCTLRNSTLALMACCPESAGPATLATGLTNQIPAEESCAHDGATFSRGKAGSGR